MKKMTFNIREDLLGLATEATGITNKTELIHRGLEELIRKKAIERLIARSGQDLKASVPSRKKKLNTFS
jgi:hypothetical protein